MQNLYIFNISIFLLFLIFYLDISIILKCGIINGSFLCYNVVKKLFEEPQDGFLSVEIK